MQILTKSQGFEWLSTFGLKSIDEEALASVYKHSIQFLIPTDTGRKTSLSRMIRNLVKYDKKICFWIIERGIFPNNENLDLFYGYRTFLGESRKVEDAPCHLFSAAESQVLESLLDISLYFVWDSLVFDPTQEIGFYLSHDEIIVGYSRYEHKIKELEHVLKNLDMEFIENK